MTILVATTVAPYIMENREDPSDLYWSNWLSNPRALKAAGEQVEFFAALEMDGRGVGVFDPLKGAMRRVGPSNFWEFSLTTGDTEFNSSNRLSRICTGRNLISEYASQRQDITHILHLDADTRPARSLLPLLLAMNAGICGAEVPTYCLSGPSAGGFPESWQVQQHMNTAGCLLVRREIFRAIRWRWDQDAGMTDDPCYYEDAKAMGYPTYVRHDTQCEHYPPVLPPLEQRGHDRRIR